MSNEGLFKDAVTGWTSILIAGFQNAIVFGIGLRALGPIGKEFFNSIEGNGDAFAADMESLSTFYALAGSGIGFTAFFALCVMAFFHKHQDFNH